MSDDYVTDAACHQRSGEILAAVNKLADRLYKDNGTLSVQTRLDRHEQSLRLAMKLVYGAISLALIGVAKALLSMVIKGAA